MARESCAPPVAIRAASFSVTACRNAERRFRVEDAMASFKAEGREENRGYSTVTVGDVEAVSWIETMDTGITEDVGTTDVSVGALVGLGLVAYQTEKATIATIKMTTIDHECFFIF